MKINFNRDKVILVDENDKEIGVMDKFLAHKKGFLHRAFSVFIFNDKNELLIQQRALQKYHSPGLWSNTCCSHPQPGEDIKKSAINRLWEEMGFTCEINHLFSFIYKAEVGNGYIEHELDHVFVGHYSNSPIPDKQEVISYKWLTINDLMNDIASHPDSYTIWFKIILEKHMEKLM